MTRERGFGSGGSLNWFVQRITGAVLLISLIIHFWFIHFFPADPHGELTFEIVMERLQNPLWRTFNLIFLFSGVIHGMNGVIINVHDYIRNPKLRIALVSILWVGAAFFLIIGTMTMLGLTGGVN